MTARRRQRISFDAYFGYTIPMLKKALFATGIAISPLFALASSVHFGEYFLKGAEKASDDIYVVGETATFAGSVAGDVVSISRKNFSESEIAGDAFLIGEEVYVQGPVGDDIRIIGGMVTLDGTVKDDVVVIGSKIRIGKAARIEGSLYAVGGEVEMDGTVVGDMKVASAAFRMSGVAEGDTELWGKAVFAQGSRIGGDFIYHTRGKAPAPTNVSITGKTILDEARRGASTGIPNPFSRRFLALKALMMLALGFTLFFFVRDRTEDVLLDILPHFGVRVLRGLLIVILMPLAIILLLPSVIGIPIAILFAASFVVLLLLSWVYAGVLLGAWCERFFFKRSPFPLSYRPVLLGIIFISLISLIPLVGLLFHGILLLAAAGSIGTLFSRYMRAVR